MVLTTIFITRHGARSNWTTDPCSGAVTGSIRSPTGIPADPALSAYGVAQAEELGAAAPDLRPPIACVISSPFYRCLQTITPAWRRLRAAATQSSQLAELPLVCDRGIGEWYGRAPFEHYGPAALPTLERLFPGVVEATAIVPPARGESLQQLHDRCAQALAIIVAAADALCTAAGPESIIICSHAAPIIAMGRALTGNMPTDPNHEDFDTYTCSISRFERRANQDRAERETAAKQVPDWRNGKGVGGGWDCTVNAAVDHLSGGGERNWHFNGDEAFLDENGDPPAPEPGDGTASKL